MLAALHVLLTVVGLLAWGWTVESRRRVTAEEERDAAQARASLVGRLRARTVRALSDLVAGR